MGAAVETPTPLRDPARRRRYARFGAAAAGLAGALLVAATGAAFGDGCRPNRPRPPIVLKDMGACQFDPQAMSFRGEPADQAKCLMRGMDATRNLSPRLESLPQALESRIGNSAGLPAREELSGFLSKQDLEWSFAAFLWQPLSRANDDDPHAPTARYFVIHDTSGPSFGRRAFPADIDTDRKINNLESFRCPDGWGKAHVVVNRSGGILLDHELAVPWRETKFERAVNFAGALKGLFVHVEMIQPRRSAGRGWHNDAQSPDPSFTAAQYDRLALLYIIASVRAGHWLVPAFHAAIDANIVNGHDDPLNFDVASFGKSLDAVTAQVQGFVREPATAAATAAVPADPADYQLAGTAIAPRPVVAADISPPANTVTVKADAAAPRLAAYTPAVKTPAANTPVAKPEAPRNAQGAHRDDKASERPGWNRASAGGDCRIVIVKGYRRRVCWTDAAAARERSFHPYVIQAADRHGWR